MVRDSEMSEPESEPDHTDQLLDENLIKFIITGIGISILTIIGIIGNLTTIFVLAKNKMYSKSINHLLLGLAISDMVFTTTSSFLSVIPTICIYYQIDFTQFLSTAISPFIYGISVTAYLNSTYFTLAITIERYLAIAWPLKSRHFCTPRKAIWASIGITCWSVVHNFPRYFEYVYTKIPLQMDYSRLNDGDGDNYLYMILTTEFRRDPMYNLYYVKFANITLLFIIPLSILIVLNTRIYRIVKLARQHRKDLTTNSHEDSEDSLAQMLIVVVTVFICCTAFGLIEGTFKAFNTTKSRHNSIAEAIRNFLLVFNSSVNFIIYCAYGKTFRSMLINSLPDCSRSFFKIKQTSCLLSMNVVSPRRAATV